MEKKIFNNIKKKPMTIQEKFSEENTRKEIVEAIERVYGKDHKIKLALLKVEDNYDDENNNYSSNLILIDENYNELNHKINIPTPNDEDEFQHYEESDGDYLPFNDVTVKF